MKTSLEWLTDQLNAQTDKCIIWPFSVKDTGYGQLRIKGKHYRCHRLMCEMANGPAPMGSNDAAHSCGNKLCVNPRHLRWASRAENEGDKLAHGTAAIFTAAKGVRNGRAKLNPELVCAIRMSSGSERSIARKFGVSRATIRAITDGITWSHVRDGERA